MKDAVVGLVKIIEDYNITKEEKLHAIMKEDNFNAWYKDTTYFKYFLNTPRYPDLREAIDDLLKVFPSNQKSIENIYSEHTSNPAEVVTLI